MRLRCLRLALVLGLAAGCAGRAAIGPTEALDERTGMTLASLPEPIEFVQSEPHSALAFDRRSSFAYFGPVEWNRMGAISYGLWIDVAPGNDGQIGDIREAGAVSLLLDDGSLVLAPIETPQLAREPYRPSVAWGQAAYFKTSLKELARMAASRKLELQFRSVDAGAIRFLPSHDAAKTLTEYLRSRGATGD